MKITGIIGSYRKKGYTDIIVNSILDGAREEGAEVISYHLLDVHVEHCFNCRSCMQAAGEAPPPCVNNDDVREVLDNCLESDVIIMGSPLIFGSTAGIMKIFLDRMGPLLYWPWERRLPEKRQTTAQRKAVLVSSYAAPDFLKNLFSSQKQSIQVMKLAAELMGAKVNKVFRYNGTGESQDIIITDSQIQKYKNYGRKLAR